MRSRYLIVASILVVVGAACSESKNETPKKPDATTTESKSEITTDSDNLINDFKSGLRGAVEGNGTAKGDKYAGYFKATVDSLKKDCSLCSHVGNAFRGNHALPILCKQHEGRIRCHELFISLGPNPAASDSPFGEGWINEDGTFAMGYVSTLDATRTNGHLYDFTVRLEGAFETTDLAKANRSESYFPKNSKELLETGEDQIRLVRITKEEAEALREENYQLLRPKTPSSTTDQTPPPQTSPIEKSAPPPQTLPPPGMEPPSLAPADNAVFTNPAELMKYFMGDEDIDRTTAFSYDPELKIFCAALVTQGKACEDVRLIFVTTKYFRTAMKNRGEIIGGIFFHFPPAKLSKKELKIMTEKFGYPYLIIIDVGLQPDQKKTVLAHEYGHFLYEVKQSFIAKNLLAPTYIAKNVVPPTPTTISPNEIEEAADEEIADHTHIAERLKERNLVLAREEKEADYIGKPTETFGFFLQELRYMTLYDHSVFEDFLDDMLKTPLMEETLEKYRKTAPEIEASDFILRLRFRHFRKLWLKAGELNPSVKARLMKPSIPIAAAGGR